jgi:surface antigen
MNGDEIDALVTKIVLGVFSTGFGASLATQDQESAIATGIGALAAIAYGVYKHWNMRKVPETATVVAPKNLSP